MSSFPRVAGLALSLFFLASAGAVQAQEASKRDCDRVAQIVMGAVNARVDGATKAATRRTLRTELGRTAGDELADWVYGLPEEMLSEEVGKAWKSQCETL